MTDELDLAIAVLQNAKRKRQPAGSFVPVMSQMNEDEREKLRTEMALGNTLESIIEATAESFGESVDEMLLRQSKDYLASKRPNQRSAAEIISESTKRAR